MIKNELKYGVHGSAASSQQLNLYMHPIRFSRKNNVICHPYLEKKGPSAIPKSGASGCPALRPPAVTTQATKC
jgi:hypothetical protein